MVQVYKKAYRVAAREAASAPLLDEVAAEVATVARAEAARHYKSGHLEESIHVEKGRIDRIVYSDHPRVLHIEYGHASLNGTWVPGLHVMANAARKVGGG